MLGVALGAALTSEYTAGIVIGALLSIALTYRECRLRKSVLGLALPCLLIPLYSWTTIGIPWELPYSYNNEFPEMKTGLLGIRWPHLTTVCDLLISPARGLLFWSPFLVMALYGAAWLRAFNGRLCILSYLIPLMHILVISGKDWDWSAGPTFSARYLAPAIPLLAISCAIGSFNHPKLALILGAYSIAITGLATITCATFSYPEISNPLFSVSIPCLLRGDFNPSLVSITGIGGTRSGVVLFAGLLLPIIAIIEIHSVKRAMLLA
jgi:hypothetical protein